MTNKEIARAIKNYREDHDILAKDVAAAINVSESTYSKYENGKLVMDIETIFKITTYLGTNLEELQTKKYWRKRIKLSRLKRI